MKKNSFLLRFSFLCAICVICGLFSPETSGPGFAQTVTITQTTTYQTWKATHSVFDRRTAETGCPALTTTQLNQLLDYFVRPLHVNSAEIQLDYRVNTESTNDNNDPAALVRTPFTTAYSATYTIAGCSGFAANLRAADSVLARKKMLRAGLPVEWLLRVFGYASFTGLPAHVKTGSGSIGIAEDEAREFIYGFENEMFLDVGWHPDYVLINEPNATSGYFQAAGTTDWMGGVSLSLKNWYSGLGLATRYAGPTPSSGNADTIADLDKINLVTGGEAALGRISYHCYSCPSAANAATIASRAAADGVDTWLEEAAPSTGGIGLPADSGFANARTYLSGSIIPQINNANIAAFGQIPSVAVCTAANVGCDPTATQAPSSIYWENDLSTFYLEPWYFALYQLFHYALVPGNVRVGSSSTNGNIVVTAWKRPDATVVVVLANATGGSANVTINGLNNTLHDIFKVDPTLCSTTGFYRCAPASSTATPSGGSTSITIPTNGIWTVSERPTAPVLRMVM